MSQFAAHFACKVVKVGLFAAALSDPTWRSKYLGVRTCGVNLVAGTVQPSKAERRDQHKIALQDKCRDGLCGNFINVITFKENN